MKRKKVDNENELRIIIAVLLVLIVGIFTLIIPQIQKSESNAVEKMECVTNSDCIIIRGVHCDCDDGGAPQCVPKNLLGEYSMQLSTCNSFGTQSDNCGRITCGCVNNRCVGRPV